MKDYIPPEQLLTRILQVAQLLTYTQPLQPDIVPAKQCIEPITPSIIVGNDKSGENVEKLLPRE